MTMCNNLTTAFITFYKYLGMRLFMAFSMALFAGLAESFGILMFLPILASLKSNDTDAILQDNQFFQKFFQNFLEKIPIDSIFISAITLIALAFALKGLFVFATQYLIGVLKADLQAQLKIEILQSLVTSEYLFFEKYSSGEINNIVVEQVNRIILSFHYIMQIFVLALYAFIYLSTAMSVEWQFTMISLVAGSISVLLFRPLGYKAQIVSKNTSTENAKLEKNIVEFVSSLGYYLATGLHKNQARKIDSFINILKRDQIIFAFLNSVYQGMREPITVTIILIVVYIQTVILGSPLEAILVTVVVLFRGISSLLGVQANWLKMNEFSGSLSSVVNFNRDAKEHKRVRANEKPPENFDGIKLEKVTFDYEAAPSVLDEISLTLPAKKISCLVGPSGSGKSTLLKLLLKLIEPTSGKIYVGDAELRLIDEVAWARHIGYVSQDTPLPSGTIREFFQQISEISSISELKIENALKEVGLDQFIAELTDGIDTVIREGGRNFSGGQRQRLLIAREILKEPSFLFLDEPTSALDQTSATVIKDVLWKLRGNMTIVLITHDLNLSQFADVTHVLGKNGKLQDEY